MTQQNKRDIAQQNTVTLKRKKLSGLKLAALGLEVLSILYVGFIIGIAIVIYINKENYLLFTLIGLLLIMADLEIVFRLAKSVYQSA